LTCGYRAIVEPITEDALQTPDGYWRVEVVRYGRKDVRYRVTHAQTVLGERLSLGTVQRMLGEAFGTLQPVDQQEADDTA
jgi:hypothetical protein